jgi:SAM-dependent methyltransferase
MSKYSYNFQAPSTGQDERESVGAHAKHTTGLCWMIAMATDRQSYWKSVYRKKDAQRVSWYRPHLDVSLRLMQQAGLGQSSRVIDVGAGASTLIDDLLALGIESITALDLSEESLAVARARLASSAGSVQWIVADVTTVKLVPSSIDIWHDRAALHFLMGAHDVSRYVEVASSAIASGGYAVIGGFALDGPTSCSGLPVARRGSQDIAALFAPRFVLADSVRETHRTPSGNEQSFAYTLLRKI